jgi:hypothetical protein
MDKRNTVIASIILVVLVLLLIGKGVRHHHRDTIVTDLNTQQVDCLLDLNLATGFDSATVKACDMPIVIHYPKPTNINGSRTQIHVFSLTKDVLISLATPKKGGILPDSTQAIHIYPKFVRSKTSYTNLGFYSKYLKTQDVQYVVTYPVEDSLGLHVIEDSGLIVSVVGWKTYGTNTKQKSRKECEDEMSKQIEESLIKDVAKKMKPV